MNLVSMTTSPMATLTAFEQKYRGDHTREHGLLLDRYGEMIVEREGVYDQIDFEPEELDRARGGSLSHTHRRDLPASVPDLDVAASLDLTLRVVGIDPYPGQKFDYLVEMPAFPTRL